MPRLSAGALLRDGADVPAPFAPGSGTAHLPTGSSVAVASAARYIPRPKIVCVTRLLMPLKTGDGVFRDAIPAPIPGCKMSHGATTVTVPMKSAGSKDGERAHSTPYVHSKSAEKVIPIA
jgi:hypothetical protein